MNGAPVTAGDPPAAASVENTEGVASGGASPLTRATVVEAAATTTASAALAVVVLRWVVPLCFVC